MDAPMNGGKNNLKMRLLGWSVSVGVLLGLIFFVATHLGQAKQFSLLLEQIEPVWFLVALLLQTGTYICEGTVWHLALRSGGYHLPIRTLARLSVERLSVNQVLPTSGVVGNIFVARMLRSRGVPSTVAVESMFVDILTRSAAFALMALCTLLLLFTYHDVSVVIVTLMGVFAIFIVAIPLGIWWLLEHRSWEPPMWLKKYSAISSLLHTIRNISRKQVLNPSILFQSFIFQGMIFLFDAATLLVLLQALGIDADFSAAFIAFLMGSIAAMVSFLPGGIGSFEAGCVMALKLLGLPIEAALTGTLLLRVLTFWIPLGPGLILAHADMRKRGVKIQQ